MNNELGDCRIIKCELTDEYAVQQWVKTISTRDVSSTKVCWSTVQSSDPWFQTLDYARTFAETKTKEYKANAARHEALDNPIVVEIIK